MIKEVNSWIVDQRDATLPSADSLTLKFAEAYSRATGRCRVTLLGVYFREKVKKVREMQRREGCGTHCDSRLLDASLLVY
jgi:hypothetical protein